jgi:hypothetical protein
MEHLEHIIILVIFLLAIRYIIQVFSPSNESGGCSKSCGNKCAVQHLSKTMEELEKNSLN